MTAPNPHAVNAPTTTDPAAIAAWSAETARAVESNRLRPTRERQREAVAATRDRKAAS